MQTNFAHSTALEPAARSLARAETAPAAARAGLWHRLHLGALLSHLLLAILFTWPLVLNFLPGAGTNVPGVMLEDRDQNLWNLWWVRHAVLGGHNPFVTNMIWYPTPVSLYYHTLNVFNGLLAIPLLSVFSLTTTYNIIVLFSFVMCGYGAFLLVHYLTGNRWAALVGSVVFAYSAYHIATMRSLLQLISLEWVPFFLLFFLQAIYQPRWHSARDAVRWLLRRALPAGIALFLVSLVDWYYTMYALIMAGFIALFVFLASLRGRAGEATPEVPMWRRVLEPQVRMVACLAVYGLLVSPILVPMLRELRSTNYMQPAPDAALSNSADLLTFFMPTRDQKLWGRFFTARRDWPYGSNRYEVYATYTSLILVGAALLGTRKRRPHIEDPLKLPQVEQAEDTAVAPPGKWFWALGALVFFLLALGPVLQVNGEQIKWLVSPDLSLPMPYNLVAQLPVLNISRSPDRFDMPLTLCMSVLAGYGVNVFMNRRPRRFSLARYGNGLSVACVALIALELAPMPYPQRNADIPTWYYVLGKEPGDFSILDLPPQDDYWHGAFRMYFQTAHGKHIFGGYISREYPHPFLTSTPGYQELTYVDGGGDMFDAGPNEWLSAFKQYDTRYIVLQKDRLPNYPDAPVDVAPSRDAILKVLGSVGAAVPVYSDEELDAYRVPAPPQQVPYLSVGDNWQPRERNEQGDTYRWMGNESSMRIDAPREEQAFLTFRAGSLGKPRRLQIYHGDTMVFDDVIQPGLQDYRTKGPLGLPQGTSDLRFVSVDGTSSPAELGMGDDPRQLSFVVMKAKLQPVP